MAKSNKANSDMTAEVKFRCKPEQKTTMQGEAKTGGMSLSDYVRSVLLCEKKPVFLVEGSEINKSLFHIRKELAYFRSNGGVPQESLSAFTSALENVSEELHSLNKKVSAALSCKTEENGDG